eukprot:1394440-Heterocapsa_arctica.AAC.1
MRDFCESACKAFSEDVNQIPGAGPLRLTKAETPYTTEDTAGDDSEPPGILAGVCALHLVRLLFAARVARPDLQTPI